MGTQNQRFRTVRNIKAVESERLNLQSKIDSLKKIDERRKLGQFSTPINLAREIISYGLKIHSCSEISFIDPAFGTGAFFSALLSEIEKMKKSIIKATGIEIDKTVFNFATSLWGESDIKLINADFTKIDNKGEKYNFLVCNPPYVRHQIIGNEQKSDLRKRIRNETNFDISGLAGLYCYFILLSYKWLAPGAVCGWLLPSEFMDVNYGDTIKEFLLNRVRLIRIHRYNPEESKFCDALVSSCVVWFKNEVTANDYEIEFSYGGTHEKPIITKSIKKSFLMEERKWTRFPEKGLRIRVSTNLTLGDFFDIKRGIATGDNNFFILTKEQIQELGIDMSFFKPILPSPRYLKTDEVFADSLGFPMLDKQYFLLDCSMPEEEIQIKYPELYKYLKSGISTTAKRYLCRNRNKWYFQEKREPTHFLCTYMGRSNGQNTLPFRFILNHSKAIVTNSYLMLYPKDDISYLIQSKPDIVKSVWNALKSISAENFESEGRIYGGGLKKIEPKELAKVECHELAKIFSDMMFK
ncbi:hypothetical protein BVF91_07755 [Thermoanaerobacterium sp. PSU-2]|uniref:Eco57I restriction-modification methylase domain-containing protein n=1 Tax=Thermoanaerobacterium sp. PSU-2 TaxID=1930849 RepID=UPI000A1548E4|nr:N-6 DNA methylase [Thermoanaerobacterium sp. PSU-2]ORX23167.1 hypothetical protein BVF91_07755 [Thermoanaerobacterium sp. PSU-2]